MSDTAEELYELRVSLFEAQAELEASKEQIRALKYTIEMDEQYDVGYSDGFSDGCSYMREAQNDADDA